MSGREILPLEVLRFDWAQAEARLGLPRALVDGRPARLFSVPALFVPEWDLERIEFRFGAELVICSLAWLRRYYQATDGNGADPEAIYHGDFADLPQAVRLAIHKDFGNVEWSALGMVERALAHAATAPCVAPCRGLHAEDLDTWSQDLFERRTLAILRGERVRQLVFVNHPRTDGKDGEAAC